MARFKGPGLRWAAAAALALLVPAAAAAETPAALASWFATHSVPIPTRASIVICHGFACHTRTAVALGDGDRTTLAGLVRGATAEAERRGIARAVAWFDRRTGRQTGTSGARAFARGLVGDRTQFDCIDRTTNTAGLFLVMQQLGLLRHHVVAEPTSRAFVPFVGAPHSTAVLQERSSGRKWAVDSWTRNHGELPEVMPLDRWLELD